MHKIVVAEDDRAYNNLLTEYLTANGYVVYSAYDGLDAFKKCIREKPALVITDILMPDEDGIGLLIKLKKDYPCKTIVFSGGGTGPALDYLHLAQQLGAERVLRKPFKLDELGESVKQLLES